MRQLSLFPGLLVLAAASAIAADAPWHIRGATARTRVARAADSPWPAEAGQCLLWHEGSKAEGCVAVVDASGKEVPHNVFWAPSEGEPCKVLFDCSGGGDTYYLYLLGAKRQTDSAWEPQAGLMLETRKRGEGRAETWEKAEALWNASSPVYGRSLVDRIHHGWHLHGPTLNVVSYYRGTLQIDRGGTYGFAPVSQDASFIFIDGKRVAEWPGRHEIDEGRRGEFGGSASLTPGRHRIEFYNVRFGPGMAVTAAWRLPGHRQYEVIPPEAFPPVASFETRAIETAPGVKPVPYFTWNIETHCMVEDAALVEMAFRLPEPRPGGTVRWRFDDGSTAEGPEARHLFLRPGMRIVRVEERDGEGAVSQLERTVLVQPQWSQRHDWPPEAAKRMHAELLERDLAPVPASDLSHVLHVADLNKDRPVLTRFGTACLDRHGEFAAQDSEMFRMLAEHFADPSVRMLDAAERAYRAALSLTSADSAQHQEYKMALAQLLHRGFNDLEAARVLLDSLNPRYFTRQMARHKLIVEGDLLLAEGHAESAEARYEQAGVIGYTDNRQAALRRQAWLETARHYVDREEFDAAADLVERIEWQTPTARLNADTGLLLVKVHLGRSEFSFALSKCRMLLNTETTERSRSQLLYHLVEAYLALNRRDAAQQAYHALTEEHAYTEAAARAADTWKDTFVDR